MAGRRGGKAEKKAGTVKINITACTRFFAPARPNPLACVPFWCRGCRENAPKKEEEEAKGPHFLCSVEAVSGSKTGPQCNNVSPHVLQQGEGDPTPLEINLSPAPEMEDGRALHPFLPPRNCCGYR